MVALTAFQKLLDTAANQIRVGNRHAADGMTEIYADGLHWQDQKDDESMFECSFCWVTVN